MGKFKEIDLFCQKGDKEGLIAFLAEHGIQNPHKQANIYLEEYKMNKTVKISDINKEIADEMKQETLKSDIVRSVNDLDESVDSLLNITQMLDTRIDLLKERIVTLENKLLKLREAE